MTSLSDIFEHQLFRERVFEAMYEAFESCDMPALELGQVEACLKTARSREVLSEIKLMFAPTQTPIRRDQLAGIQAEWIKYQKDNIAAILQADPSLFSSDSEFQGRVIKKAFSAKYLQEWLTDGGSIAERLSRFGGPICLIYGESDSQLSDQARRPPTFSNLTFRTISGIGHSLRDPITGKVSTEVLEALEQFLKTAIQR